MRPRWCVSREDAEIRFQVRDGRLYHEGLRIGFPDIDPELQLTSRGSVGLDKTLDLFVELPRLDPALRKEKGPAKCRITGTIDNPRIAVEDASLVLRQADRKEPILAADGINLSMRVEDAASGRVLAVEPVEVFKKKKLSLGVAPGLLKLLAPDVQSERQVDGEISLSFSTLRIPLGLPEDQAVKQLEAEGKLTLHQVSSEVKGPMWQGLIRLLADMNGKKSPNLIRLAADESEIRFQVRDGRLHHEGLRIGFPDIDPDLVIRSRGSIGLDETLDLHLELPRLRKDKRDQGPLQCHVTGTMSQPIIAIPDASLVVHLTDDDQAALTVDNVNLLFSVETSGDVRMLTLAPVKVFDKQKLTPEMGDQLLSLIDPTLTDLTGVQGTISLSFDTFRVPLGVPKDEFVKKVELSGKLHLHEITVAAKTPLLQTLVKVLADMHGKKPSDVVRVVENAEVRFQVRDGRIHHEDMRFGFPDISPDLLIRSSGSVGYDKTLDLVLDVPSILLDKANPDRQEDGSRAPARHGNNRQASRDRDQGRQRQLTPRRGHDFPQRRPADRAGSFRGLCFASGGAAGARTGPASATRRNQGGRSDLEAADRGRGGPQGSRRDHSVQRDRPGVPLSRCDRWTRQPVGGHDDRSGRRDLRREQSGHGPDLRPGRSRADRCTWARRGVPLLPGRWFTSTAGSSPRRRPRPGRRSMASWIAWKGDTGLGSGVPSAVCSFPSAGCWFRARKRKPRRLASITSRPSWTNWPKRLSRS